jgi:hypothetical protein
MSTASAVKPRARAPHPAHCSAPLCACASQQISKMMDMMKGQVGVQARTHEELAKAREEQARWCDQILKVQEKAVAMQEQAAANQAEN